MREVEEKRRRWRAQESNKKRAESLGQRMIPVVRGPNQHHYVLDHHHLARALHDEGVKEILVTLIADLSMVDREAFWVVMDNRRWVRCHHDPFRSWRIAAAHRRKPSTARLRCSLRPTAR
jgi:hypothetical protein